MRPGSCPWCTVSPAPEDVDPDALCRPHLAEHSGLTLDELDRADDDAAWDLA